MGRRTKPLVEQSFKNQHGHILQPGEPCLALTTSAGRARLHRAIFRGTRDGNAVIDIRTVKTVLKNEAGEQYDLRAETRALPYPKYPYGISYGTQAYKDAYNEYQRLQNVREVKVKERREGYKDVRIEGFRRSTLQNNNVYPADYAIRPL